MARTFVLDVITRKKIMFQLRIEGRSFRSYSVRLGLRIEKKIKKSHALNIVASLA
jgi:hypothetical protein